MSNKKMMAVLEVIALVYALILSIKYDESGILLLTIIVVIYIESMDFIKDQDDDNHLNPNF